MYIDKFSILSNVYFSWDTGVGGLTFSEHFLHIATKLPSKHVYGFGENIHHTFRHDLNYRSWPLFARDQPTSWGVSKLYNYSSLTYVLIFREEHFKNRKKTNKRRHNTVSMLKILISFICLHLPFKIC